MCKKAQVMFDAVGLKLHSAFAKTLYDETREAVRKRYVNFGTMTIEGCCQSGQALAVYYDLLDEAEKKSPDIEDLIVARQQAEQEIRDIDNLLNRITTEQRKLEIYLKKQMQDYDRLTAENKASAKVIRKIEIMEKVVAHFKQRLETESEEYSKRLEMNIQSLVDDMLKTKRKVIVSPEFAVRVVDNYNDESKSEGQFAVVSFAYIGGIFKMLRSEEHLAGKEYPLVLDAPFSKLGAENRQNVVDIMPTFAPQVILFSKDDLHGAFPTNKIGHVWTIVSNDEQNVARVE
jgi:DNA repair exonuclease SbcCD ATPase subunit